MKRKRKIISILLILALLCCSCGKENLAGETVESEQVVDEATVENHVAEEPEEMPSIVFLLMVEIYWDKKDEDINKSQYRISFFDNQGNLYSMMDSYFNEKTYKEIYDEFAAGKLNDYLTLDTTCELDELRENYELLKSVAQNEELRLIPDSDVPLDVVGNTYRWSAFYYNEEGNLSWIEFRKISAHPLGVTDRADDERAEQIYKWFVSVSEAWR